MFGCKKDAIEAVGKESRAVPAGSLWRVLFSGKGEKIMEQKDQLEKALALLQNFVCRLAEEAGESTEYGEQLWEGIRQSEGLLQELAYFYDRNRFLCQYKVAGYTLADVLIWQVDHFKLYMDRPDEMNRYRQQKLLLAAFDVMLQMEKDPVPFIEKMQGETGQDILK